MNPMYPDKVRENRARRNAARLGIQIRKSHGKLWNIHNQLGYMLVDMEKNAVMQGADYNLTIEEVESYLEEAGKEMSGNFTIVKKYARQ